MLFISTSRFRDGNITQPSLYRHVYDTNNMRKYLCPTWSNSWGGFQLHLRNQFISCKRCQKRVIECQSAEGRTPVQRHANGWCRWHDVVPSPCPSSHQIALQRSIWMCGQSRNPGLASLAECLTYLRWWLPELQLFSGALVNPRLVPLANDILIGAVIAFSWKTIIIYYCPRALYPLSNTSFAGVSFLWITWIQFRFTFR